MGQDRRVVRTKKALAQALFDLCGEKEFERITVTELTDRANVDRKTFYLHYKSVGDILEDFYAEHMTRLQETLEGEARPDTLDVPGFFRTLNGLLEENLELYQRLARGPAYDFFRERLREILRRRVLRDLENKTVGDREALPLYAEFYTDGVLGVYLEWLRGELPLSGETLARFTSQVVLEGIAGLAHRRDP